MWDFLNVMNLCIVVWKERWRRNYSSPGETLRNCEMNVMNKKIFFRLWIVYLQGNDFKLARLLSIFFCSVISKSFTKVNIVPVCVANVSFLYVYNILSFTIYIVWHMRRTIDILIMDFFNVILGRSSVIIGHPIFKQEFVFTLLGQK
jgi:hypothetical protein